MTSLSDLHDRFGNRRRERAILTASALVSVMDVLTIALIFPILVLVVRPRGEDLPAPFDQVFGAQPDTSVLYVLALSLIGLVLAKNVAMTVIMWAQIRAGQAMTLRLSQRLLQGYLHAPLEFHLERNTAQITRGIRDLPVEICLGGWLNRCIWFAEIAGIAAIVLALAVIEPVGMVAAGTLLAVLVWANHRFLGPKVRNWGMRAALTMRRTYGLITDTFPNIKVIKTTGAERQVQDRFTDLLNEGVGLAAKNRFAQLAMRPVSEIAMMSAAFFILIAIMWNRDHAIDALPALAAFTYAVFRLLPSINRISIATNELKRIQPIVAEAQAELEATEFCLDQAKQRLKAPTIRFAETLELRGISYRYPSGERSALHDIDLTIRFGEVIGIAGESGAGKSTLIDVLLGLLEPTGGQILVDGRPPSRDGFVEGTVGYVPQNNMLLDISARENIALGVLPLDIDEARLADVISTTRLEHTIADLAGGLDGVVGEQGSRLSGGQRQRFGIARALYGRPSLLILDEATSDLDTRTEYEVTMAINDLRGRTTIVLIAHRMHLLKSCDRVIFMKDGRIVDDRPYETLLKTCPEFKELATMTERYGDAAEPLRQSSVATSDR